MNKMNCPYCNGPITFWKHFNSIGPKYGYKCPNCKQKIGEPFWTNLPLVGIVFGGYFLFEEWFNSHMIIGIICIGLIVLVYRMLTTLFVPIVKKE
ncbi:hypothetical protein AN1V17_32060 [Vallitalea sediminicola]